jgi:hypothetical protein
MKKIISPQAREALELRQTSQSASTRARLEDALARLSAVHDSSERGPKKLTVAIVAKEAGVDRATLYRFHKCVVEAIRKLNVPHVVTIQDAASVTAAASVREYRQLAEQAQAEVIALARANYVLAARNNELEEALAVRDTIISNFKTTLAEQEMRQTVTPISERRSNRTAPQKN